MRPILVPCINWFGCLNKFLKYFQKVWKRACRSLCAFISWFFFFKHRCNSSVFQNIWELPAFSPIVEDSCQFVRLYLYGSRSSHLLDKPSISTFSIWYTKYIAWYTRYIISNVTATIRKTWYNDYKFVRPGILHNKLDLTKKNLACSPFPRCIVGKILINTVYLFGYQKIGEKILKTNTSQVLFSTTFLKVSFSEILRTY